MVSVVVEIPWGGGNSSSSMSYGVVLVSSIGFRGDLGAGKEQVLEIVKQRQFRILRSNMVKVCANFAQQGIIIGKPCMVLVKSPGTG